jgi:outer membrane protein assembly factor BamB
VSFDEGLNEDDGVYYTSAFNDVDEFFGGCVRSSQGNKLTLDPDGSRYRNYNFSDWHPESPNEFYAGTLLWFSQFWQLSWVMSLFETKIDESSYYGAISEQDGIMYPYDYKVTSTAIQQIHHFRFKITQDVNSTSSINITWFGEADHYKSVTLYSWEPKWGAIGVWQELDSVTDNSSEVMLHYENESLVLGEDNYMDLCVVVVPTLGDDCSLQTDYVNVRVEGTGYATEGAARFMPIAPQEISRWERFIWSGYEKPLTSISFQFYHEDNGTFTLIDDDYIDDNSKGISDKIIDLSSVPNSVNLTINVSLSTNDLSITPEVYDWGVSWQISDDYYMDQFSTNLRVDESTLKNIRLVDGKAHLVTTVYDWPMFGQNPENTRASPGLGPGVSYSSLCWESKEKVGGNQKNPIVNDGIIYIANSLSSRVYAYDAQYDTSYVPNSYMDYSKILGYDIKNSLAVSSKNTVIVATGSSTPGGGISNKVFALNANNLQNQEWMFSFGSVNPDDASICFESSPVIRDNNIYLTSWNGDSSLISDFFDFLNFSKGNNKLICLTDGGSFEWSQDLPSGSLCSPAVSEDIIVAGCEKNNGDSLHAFTLDGTKLWSVDVGPIGYASPVISGDFVFVVSKKIPTLSGVSIGTNAFTQVMCVSLSDGSIKWNTTIGDIIIDSYANAAFSSPVVANDFVYVASPDGILYKLDTDDGSVVKSKKIYNKGVSSVTVRSSPAFADGMIYIGTPDGYIHAINAVTLEESWKKQTNPVSPIHSSPIVVDGFVYYVDESGALYCRGRQQISDDEEIAGELISKPISLPDDELYWDTFLVNDVTNTGYITYSVLKENYQVLINDIDHNEELSQSVLEDIDTIRLKASFHANAKVTVTLDSWKVTFKDELNGDSPTEFSDFSKNLTEPPVFSINVQDDDGLNNTTARFKLEYSNESSGTYETEWLQANFSGENLTTDEETITVNMSFFDFSDTIDLYHQIRFSINDSNGKTAYSSWYSIEGKPDEEPPLFILDSFTPDPPYISTMTPTCTIQAKDNGTNGNITGMNVHSAMYTISYRQGSTSKTHSQQATCSGTNGTTGMVTITADLSESLVSDNITTLESIRFSIEDMNGNSNQTEWIDLFFDDTPPTSSISNSEEIPSFSNASFILINATATDPETTGEYASGVKEIKLFYQKQGSTQWTQFGSECAYTECSWEFTVGETDGGEYSFCTIATDNASNEESFPDDPSVFLTYDPNPPTVSFTNQINEITTDEIPSFDQVTFEDDYQLDKIYYRLNSDAIDNWTLIKTSSRTTETPEWSISETQWNEMVEDEISYVYFKVTDALGNSFVTESTADAFKIMKNIEAETQMFTLDIDDFTDWQWDNTYRVRVNTQNASISSMTLWYRYAGEIENSTGNWTKFDDAINASPFEWDFVPEDGSGYYQFYVEITTAAGSTISTSVESIYITLFPLTELIIALVVTMILFAVSGLVIKKYRQKQAKKKI